MESEKATRHARIDPRLASAGWAVTPFDSSMVGAIPSGKAVEEWPTEVGPADYVLCDEHAVRGIVEAKKLTVGAQGILPQAERYARAIRIDQVWCGEFGVPFLYSTNGDETWFHDVRHPQNRSARLACGTSPPCVSGSADDGHRETTSPRRWSNTGRARRTRRAIPDQS